MNLNKYLPLTETTYYILLALLEEGHGYAIMQKVELLSEGKVRIAAGTMYGAIENLLKQELIYAIPTSDTRRKVYHITAEGKTVLNLEIERLSHLIAISNKYKI
ncbi:MAG: PadR family transcriptional regulator [Firmicutes bacterium HGW-Firmicutes-7]|nr:MAG: PadR family transcriptional regulator [Firmicutes bacterium HGW-Firmicutes-7]